jgi:hypothetical protein
VSNLADLELDKEYYLPSGNFVVLHGGENPVGMLFVFCVLWFVFACSVCC